MAKPELTLHKVGFDPYMEAGRASSIECKNMAVSELRGNLSSYEREYLMDKATSYYPYYIVYADGRNRISSSEEKNNEQFLVANQINPDERDGLTLEGWNIFEEKLTNAENGSQFIWISPSGSAGTKGEFADTDYPYHQVYIGKKFADRIDAWALKCDMDDADLGLWLASFSDDSDFVVDCSAEYFLKNPVVSFKDPLRYLQDISSKYGLPDKFYGLLSVEDILQEMVEEKHAVSETVNIIVSRVESAIQANPLMAQHEMRGVIQDAYLDLLQTYQDERGSVQLSGSCGGVLDINSLFGETNESNTQINTGTISVFTPSVFSTEFRMQSIKNKDTLKCTCPFCHKKVTAKISRGKITCPLCSKSAPYKC